jgi:predicted branched-subunit amino acid permease
MTMTYTRDDLPDPSPAPGSLADPALAGERPERAAWRDAWSLVPAVVPLGLAMGVALGDTSAPAAVSWLSSLTLMAGASQLALFSQLDAGASLLVAVGVVIVINARFLVYGAVMAPHFRDQPRWFRALGAGFVVDQSYALTSARWPGVRSDPVTFRRYYLALVAVLGLAWSSSVAVGVAAGPIVPAWLPLEVVVPAMFIAMVVPGMRRLTEVAAGIFGLVAVGALFGLPAGTEIAVAALGGALIGFCAQDRP